MASVTTGSQRMLRLANEDDAPIAPEPAKSVRLHHFPTSLCSQKVRLALAEKGVAWESKIVNIGPAHQQLLPEYAKLNPRLVVPTLEIDGTVITNSREIIEAIDRRLPGPTLIPADVRDEVLRWVDLQDRLPMRELELAQTQGLVRWLRRWSLDKKRKHVRKLARKHPELAAIYQAKLADLDTLATVAKSSSTELVDEMEGVLDALERHLGHEQWLAGHRYTLADLVWTAVIARLEHIGFARMLAEHRRPHLAAWYARVRKRPSWSAMIRRLSVGQALRYYGPFVLKTFLLVWVLKWAVVIGIGWALSLLAG